ncbi:hypothetical protein HYH02_000190 [Chlamydomonas schloesseri]|uniref:GTPase Der n=1 Tax=Chlamydomonas schloesseri TaxID=2026947 RepID=A0A835WMB8_9CHLO|nr:hypothetical protein HYH02_000190 [Chlamydomonas schloesseri]|eukprot:KAG2450086.1 hypothetical protein HYH02_000190 [Chlamydomonas schloesseri]
MLALIAGVVGTAGGLRSTATSAGLQWLQQLALTSSLSAAPSPASRSLHLARYEQRWPPALLLLTGAVRELRTGSAARRRELLLQQRKQQAAQATAAVDDALLPKIALVGRPNVGKSALFNRLVRRRQALVYDTPSSHVTRDYQEGRGQLGDLVFRVADTSGLEPRTAAAAGTIQGRATAITAKLLSQSHLALMVVDAKTGVLPADEELAEWLRRHVPGERVMVVANKAEGGRAQAEMPQTVYDCYRLGFGEPVAVSATTGEGLADLFAALQPPLDAVSAQLRAADEAARQRAQERREKERAAREERQEEQEPARAEVEGGGAAGGRGRRRPRLFPAAEAAGAAAEGGRGERAFVVAQASSSEDKKDEEDGEDEEAGPAGGLGVMKLAIMGLPNAGKSTLLNALLGEQRAVTGPEPGLTRDSVRAAWTYGDTAVELVDTAGWVGLGRTASYDDVGGAVAAMSRRAALTSLAQVHVVLLVLDAERALASDRVMSRRELSLAGTVLREGKALVVVANKADVLSVAQRRAFAKALRRHLSERFLDAGELPVVEVSARAGTGLDGVMPTALAAYTAWNKRVTTARLNRFLQKLQLRCVGTGGLEATLERVKFITQLKARPPTFTAFMSGSTPVDRDFGAFLAAQLREVLGFQGVPLRVWFRYKEKRADRLKRLRAAAVERRHRAREQAPLAAGAYELGDGDETDDEEGEEEVEENGARAGTGARGGGGGGGGSIMELARRRAAELRRDGAEAAGNDAAKSAWLDTGSDSAGSASASTGKQGLSGRKRAARWAEEESGYDVWVAPEEQEEGQAQAAQADRRAHSAAGMAGTSGGAKPPGSVEGRGHSEYGVPGGSGPGRPGDSRPQPAAPLHQHHQQKQQQPQQPQQEQQPRLRLLADEEHEEELEDGPAVRGARRRHEDVAWEPRAVAMSPAAAATAAAAAAAAVANGSLRQRRQAASSKASEKASGVSSSSLRVLDFHEDAGADVGATARGARSGGGSSSYGAGKNGGSSSSQRAALRTAAALLLTARKPSAPLTPARPRPRTAGAKAKAAGSAGWGGSAGRSEGASRRAACPALELQELWERIFVQHLAVGSLEPSGTAVRGPGVVAADLVRGGLACRGMYAASRVALEALAEQAEALGHMSRRRPFLARWQPDAAVDWVRLDKVLRRPEYCSAPEFRTACAELGVSAKGNKAVLQQRLLARCHVPPGRCRCPVPARLWAALWQERVCEAQQGDLESLSPEAVQAVTELAEVEGTYERFWFRSKACIRRSLAVAYGDTPGLMAAHRACLPRLPAVRAERARQKEEQKRRWQEEERRQRLVRQEEHRQKGGAGAAAVL